MKYIMIKIVNFIAILKSLFFGVRYLRLKQTFNQKYFSFMLTRFFKHNVICYGEPIINGRNNIYLSGNLTIGYRARIEAIEKYYGQTFYPQIFFGDNVIIGDNCHIGAINKIKIGDNTLIGSNVLIIDHSHGDIECNINILQRERPLLSKGEIKIGKNCWICDDVKILSGVTIPDNCIIGAGSIVTKSIEESDCVVCGTPARIVKRASK